MKISTKIYKGSQIAKCKDWKDIIRLKIRNGLIKFRYKECSDPTITDKYKNKYTFAVTRIDNVPVSIVAALKLPDGSFNVHAYTKPKFRMKGLLKLSLLKLVHTLRIPKKPRKRKNRIRIIVHGILMHGFVKRLGYSVL